MRKQIQARGVIAAGMASLTMGSIVTADIIEARFDQVSPRRNVTLSNDDGESYWSTQAGYFNWTFEGGDFDQFGVDDEFITFCIELTQNISGGSAIEFETRLPEASPNPGVGMGSERAGLLSEFFGRYYALDFDNDQAAAFQIGVWEITHDDGLDLDDGEFRVQNNGAYYAQAVSWLGGLNGNGPFAELMVMSNPNRQDQVFRIPGPASLACLGLLAAIKPRRRRA